MSQAPKQPAGADAAPASMSGAAPLELGGVALVLVLVIAAQLSRTESWWLFERYFWLDEIYTHTLVADPSLSHALHALAGGVETHPPALYLLLRGYTRLVGSTGEIALRSFALLSVLAGLVGIYACLRRCFAWWGCLAVVLGAWAHPLLLDQAFNARFYGPWLAAAVWCAFFLVRVRVPGRPGSQLALAGCAAIVCTLHYFGILSLLLIVGGELLARRHAGVPLLRGMVPVAAGPLALALCLPLLRSQHGALAETVWMAPIDLQGVLGLVRQFVEGYPFGWLALAAWLSVLLSPSNGRPGWGPLAVLAGVAALIGLPAIMVAFSYAVQPVYDPRYSFPAVAGVVALAGWLGGCCTRGWALILCAWLAVVGGLGLQREAQQAGNLWVALPRQLMAELRHAEGAPILFELPWQLYVVYRYAPDLRSRCALLDDPTGELPGRLPAERFGLELGRCYSKFYPEPPTIPWPKARRLPRFFLVSGDYGLMAKEPLDDRSYPGFRVRPFAPGVYELTAIAQANPR